MSVNQRQQRSTEAYDMVLKELESDPERNWNQIMEVFTYFKIQPTDYRKLNTKLLRIYKEKVPSRQLMMIQFIEGLIFSPRAMREFIKCCLNN
jgi:hypothetical protein